MIFANIVCIKIDCKQYKKLLLIQDPTMAMLALPHPYKLRECINSGRYGTVYKATAIDDLNAKTVAVKILRKVRHDVPMETNTKLINNETTNMRKVRGCSNIVNLHDVYEDDESVYLAQEYCANGSLEDLIKQNKGRMSEKRVARLIKQILVGVDHCHIHNVYHGDIKPNNILIERFLHLKLADFGHSQASFNAYSGCFGKRGTPFYAAPELFLGMFGHIADIWPVGVITHYMLHGEHPLVTEAVTSGREIYESLVANNIKFTNHAVSAKARDFIRHTLTVDPHARLSAYECLHHPFIKDV